jgi:hypothetical protein
MNMNELGIKMFVVYGGKKCRSGLGKALERQRDSGLKGDQHVWALHGLAFVAGAGSSQRAQEV